MQDIYSKKAKYCCYDCKDRTVGCHSKCDNYKALKAKNLLIKTQKDVEKGETITARKPQRISCIAFKSPRK